MKEKPDTLHMTIPATIQTRMQMKALREDKTMQEWVLTRILIGLEVGK